MGFIRLPRAHQILRKMRDGRIRRLNLNRDLAPRERLISFASADGYCLGLRPRVSRLRRASRSASLRLPTK
jgi:hypothetical protein